METRDSKGKFIKGHKKIGTYSTPKGVHSHMKGKHHSESAKEKNRIAHLGMKPNADQLEGLKNGRLKGKKFSDIAKENMRNATPRGENSHFWKDGRTLGENKNGYYRNKVIARRAMKRGADGFHTSGEWDTLKIQYNWTCPHCKKSEPEIKLTEDHLIPLIKGGSNNIENIQPLCGKCNSRKGARLISFIC
jgi:hypothetical protein